MSRLWIPEASRAQLDSRRAQEADIITQGRVDHVCELFNRELRSIDPYLEMRFFGEDTRVMGAVPGRYHLTRRPPDAPAALISISGPNGEFVEPNSAIFAKLAEGDMWSSEANRERRRRERLAEEAAERKRRREEEERQEHLKDAWNAAFRTSVSMNRDTPWTQNNSANSRRARGQKKAA